LVIHDFFVWHFGFKGDGLRDFMPAAPEVRPASLNNGNNILQTTEPGRLENIQHAVYIYSTVFLYRHGGAMEHLVRVQNERDRRTLAWLRAQVGDVAIAEAAQQCVGPSKPYLSAVCRLLGVTAPRFTAPRRPVPSATAEQSLATMRQILASRNGRLPPTPEAMRRG
jgi:hypothetical protein